MIIPYLSLFIFALLGSWMMIDNTPSFIIAYFPEFVGRLTLGVIYNIVTLPPVIELFVRIAPKRSILFYMRFDGDASHAEYSTGCRSFGC